MSENIIKGAAQNSIGKAESLAGDVFDVSDLKVRGATDQASGAARKATGKVQAQIDKVASKLSDGVSKAADKTAATYDRAAVQAKKAAETVDPFVHERPYAAAGLALGVGVVIGMLLARPGPKIIYVKPRV